MKLETYKPILLAMSIGDGHVGKNGDLEVLHSSKQEEYLRWKADKVKKLITTKGVHYKENSGFGAYKFRVSVNYYLKSLRYELYPEGKKRITRNILNQLTPEGIAIWYMDDGGLSPKKRDGNIYAYELFLNTLLSREDNQIIIDYFKEVWGISFTQVHNKNGLYRLRCGTKEGRKFIEIVEPTVRQVPSMCYKIDLGRHK